MTEKEIQLTLSLNVESIEDDTPEENEDDEYPQRVVYGYSAGDEVDVGGKTQTIRSLSFTQGFGADPHEFRFTMESGLNISGPMRDVVRIFDE